MGNISSMQSNLSEKDLQIITSQLGRVPAGTVKVAIRDIFNIPAVIEVTPIVRQKPFPTLYWLSHRDLSKKIDHLEASGLIKELEIRVEQDAQFKQRLHEAHQDYRDQRVSRLRELEEYQQLPPSFIESLEQKGIGGIADFNKIRCLHMHYAHHLVTGKNPVGTYLDEVNPSMREFF